MKTLTIEQQKIKLQIECGFGFYGAKYQKAVSIKERQNIIKKALALCLSQNQHF